MNRIILILLSAIAIFNLSCTTTKVTSKVMALEYRYEVSDIFYAINFPKKMEKTVPSLIEETEKIYSKNAFGFGYEEYTFFTNVGEFTFKKVLAKAKESEFNYLLLLKETDHERTDSFNGGFWGANGMYMGGGNSKSITHGLEAFLYSVTDTTEIWRAQIEVNSGDYGNSAQTGRSLANGVVKNYLKIDY